MNKRRLRDLVNVLRKVKPKDFHMARWGPSECGTACCAVGHYILAYPRRGLKMETGGTATLPTDREGCYSYHAVAFHFDIPVGKTFDLFSPGERDYTPKAKARQIEKFIETGEVPQ
jgi:hypothetical protein